ncbi:putative cAMP-dependent protein kinase catalytic subunit [Ixodes scapularis]
MPHVQSRQGAFNFAEGELEVEKEDRVLGRMGPGKAFGELAILYNCTRTASVKAVTKAKVWVLDRRVFQAIMMKTGLQRQEENIQFLRSVPLLQTLSNEVLAKMSDVLEVQSQIVELNNLRLLRSVRQTENPTFPGSRDGRGSPHGQTPPTQGMKRFINAKPQPWRREDIFEYS